MFTKEVRRYTSFNNKYKGHKMLKFFFNGIKSSNNENKLEKASISFASYEGDRISVYAKGATRFSSEIRAEFFVKNDTDSQVDYFDSDTFYILPTHKYFLDAMNAILKDYDRRIKIQNNQVNKAKTERKRINKVEYMEKLKEQRVEIVGVIAKYTNSPEPTETKEEIMAELKEVLFTCRAGTYTDIKGDKYHTLILTKRVKRSHWKAFKTLIRVENIGYYSKKAKAIVCDKVKPAPKATAQQIKAQKATKALAQRAEENKISLRAFEDAGRWTYSDPQTTAERQLESFNNYLKTQKEEVLNWANEEDKEKALTLFMQWEKGYINRYKGVLDSESRTASTFITGASNFPVARQNKLKNVVHNKQDALSSWSTYKLNKIRNIFQPTIIKSTDDQAIDKLEEKLNNLEAAQVEMKEANKLIRGHKGTDTELKAIFKERGFNVKCLELSRWHTKKGYASYSLTNNNATIRNTRKRLEKLKADRTNAQAIKEGRADIREHGFDGGKVLYNYEAQRVQILFDDIPSKEVRRDLKTIGCRWSPKNSAWQLHLKEHNYSKAIELTNKFKNK